MFMEHFFLQNHTDLGRLDYACDAACNIDQVSEHFFFNLIVLGWSRASLSKTILWSNKQTSLVDALYLFVILDWFLVSLLIHKYF